MSEVLRQAGEIKSMSAKGIEFLIGNEGLLTKPYLDSVGVPTIGVGCTYYEDGRRVKMSDPAISRERAIQLFKNVLSGFEKTIWSCTRDDINQNQFDALTSFCFNIGQTGFKNSTALRLINKNPNDQLIAEAMMMWKKPKEIIGRRKKEVALYFS